MRTYIVWATIQEILPFACANMYICQYKNIGYIAYMLHSTARIGMSGHAGSKMLSSACRDTSADRVPGMDY